MCYNGKTATGFVNQLGPIWQLRLSDKADGREFTVIDMFENAVYPQVGELQPYIKFQLDCAPPHFKQFVKLNDKFPNR